MGPYPKHAVARAERMLKILGLIFVVMYLGLTVAVVVMSMSGCTDPSRQVQAKVADAVSIAANAAGPKIIEQYKKVLDDCVANSHERPDYILCRAKADHDWTKVRMDWAHLRNAQNEYATALEHHDASLQDYMAWLRIAYCELRADFPKSGTLPEVPGFSCPEVYPGDLDFEGDGGAASPALQLDGGGQ